MNICGQEGLHCSQFLQANGLLFFFRPSSSSYWGPVLPCLELGVKHMKHMNMCRLACVGDIYVTHGRAGRRERCSRRASVFAVCESIHMCPCCI